MTENKLYENLKDRTLSRNRAVIEKMIKQDIRGLVLSPNAKNLLVNKIYTYRSGRVKEIFNNKVKRALRFDPNVYTRMNDAKKLLNTIKIHTFPSKKAAIEKYLSKVNNKNIKNTYNKLQAYGIVSNKEIKEYNKKRLGTSRKSRGLMNNSDNIGIKRKLNNRNSIMNTMKNIKKLNIGDRGHYNINTTIITNNRNSVVILGKRYNINTTTRLVLWRKNLTSLPESIGKLTNLKELYLGGNKLRTLPESFGQLTKLEDLRLGYNKLTSLPESIGRLTNLVELGFENNELTSLPESIGKLTNLTELYLDRNKLTQLPESFGNLTKLDVLKLGYNKLTSLPESFKNLDRNLRIDSRGKTYNRDEFIKLYGIVDKNVYLRNINIRLRNSSLNNFENTVERIKTNLPPGVSRNDVNTIVRSMKPQVLQKIFNKLKNSPSNNRVRIMNTMKNRGFMNQNDITAMKKKLLGLNFVRNSKKPLSTTITKKVNKMNINTPDIPSRLEDW